MEEVWNQITRLIGAYIPKLLGALAILIVGWLVPHQLFLTSIPRWCGTRGVDTVHTVQRLLKARITLEREGPAHSAGLFLFP